MKYFSSYNVTLDRTGRHAHDFSIMQKGTFSYLLLIVVFLLGQQVAVIHPITHLGQHDAGGLDPQKQQTQLEHCDQCVGCQQLQAIVSGDAVTLAVPSVEHYGTAFSNRGFVYQHASLYFARAPPTVIS